MVCLRVETTESLLVFMAVAVEIGLSTLNEYAVGFSLALELKVGLGNFFDLSWWG
jgi:hypothetical protein